MQRLRRDFFRTLEAGLAGLFLIQSIRFLYATLYARASSADLVGRVPDESAIDGLPGVVEMATVQTELVIVAVLALLPLLAIILGRWRISFPLTVLLMALGRSVALQIADFTVPAAGLVAGAGLLYLTLTVIRRPEFFPPMLLLGFTAEQLIRAFDNTRDPTWQGDYVLTIGQAEIEMSLLIPLVSIVFILLSILLVYFEHRYEQHRREVEEDDYTPPPRGVMNLWGGLALGGILFLELTILALPNVIARWSGLDYAGIVPWLLAATVLPLVPEVREFGRRFAGMFDSAWRGWLWMLLLGLTLVVGRRYDGVLAGVSLVTAQFLVGMTLWWLIQVGQPRVNLSALATIFGVIVFLLLAAGDYFTYDYAYVRDLQPPYENVDDVLRAFRDMGLGLALAAALLASIPIIVARKRIPWQGGPILATLVTLLLVIGVALAGVSAATDHTIRRSANPNCLRVVTYNIHGGYSQFFDPNLPKVAEILYLNGADIALLQEVDTGRMASYGVDQVLWLARELDMEAAFFPQNEALQGLAVLSRVPIEDVEGLLLPSQGAQAAVQHVTLAPEKLVADPQAANLGDLHVYNAWLGFRVAERDGQPVPEGEQDQNRQMEAMLNWIAAERGPDWTERIILGGTFNHGPDSPLYQRLRMANLSNPAIIDPVADIQAEDAKTLYLVDGTSARYDYLWIFNLTPNGVLIDNSPLAQNTSDHRSIVVGIHRRMGDDLSCPS